VYETKNRARKEHMVDILLFAMVIASAVSLVVVSPRREQQKTLRTLREYDDTEHYVSRRGLQEDGAAGVSRGDH
jgi:hypothetical protein